MTDPASAPAAEQIDVGDTRDTLRIWLAREKMRQAEMALAGQTSNLTALEARATAILQWSSAAMVGLAAIMVQTHAFAAPGLGIILLALAAFACMEAIWPREWHQPGWPPDELARPPYRSELLYREAIAGGYQRQIEENAARLKQFGLLLRAAWIAFAAAGPAAAITALIP